MACSCSPASSAHVVTLSPAYPGSGPSWKLIAVRDLGQHVVGDHPQVGDAEQDVGRVRVEAGGQLGAGADDGDALLDGVVADDRRSSWR